MKNLPDSVVVFNQMVQQYFKICYDVKVIVTNDYKFARSSIEFYKFSLVRLVEHFGLKVINAHNAACDAEMTLRLFFHIKNSVKNLELFSNRLYSLEDMSHTFEGYINVWESNLQISLKAIRIILESDRILNQKTVIAIDTEFPRNPLGSDHLFYKPGSSQAAYDIMKRNVDSKKVISLG